MEQIYQFRQDMLQVHKPDLLCADYKPAANDVHIDEQFCIVIPENSSEVLTTGALDLQDFLFTSMKCSVPVYRRKDLQDVTAKSIVIATSDWLGRLWEQDEIPASYQISVSPERIVICGFDDRGCAQGCYQLEDRMSAVRAPYVKTGHTHYAPAFSPRMVHSGYGLDQFPDGHLSAIAHAGMDAILLFVKDVDRTPFGFLNFNDLIKRAAKYGLDVYAYSYYASEMHPDDVGAFEHYNSTYGNLFRQCPGIKGVVLVGESVEFPSKDPRISPFRYYNNTIDGLPTGKLTAGWFPCNDYYKWLQMLQKVIYQYKPDADIVLWTYNWGRQPEEDRLKFIDAMPKGISLMATFEMYDTRRIDGLLAYAVDYTLSFTGPGKYFISEAKRAKERGIRLYSQANSGGLTWDFGVIPYEPFPEQWVKRYGAMLEAKREYGLCGIMESHHYGFYPSFISKIEKRMFTEAGVTGEEAIRSVAAEYYGSENLSQALEAWHLLSQALHYYPSAAEDQYGPFRIGPAYPLVFRYDVQIPTVPYAHFGGNTICFTDYASDGLYRITSAGMRNTGLIQQRIPGEIRCLEKMRDLLRQGRNMLESLTVKLEGRRKDDCLRLINQIHFMENTATTAIHVKEFAKRKWQVRTLTDPDELAAVLREMIAIAGEEIRNAEATIPLAEYDSRLGWEPSMEYIGGVRHLNWKIRQTRQVMEQELPQFLEIVYKQETGD